MKKISINFIVFILVSLLYAALVVVKFKAGISLFLNEFSQIYYLILSFIILGLSISILFYRFMVMETTGNYISNEVHRFQTLLSLLSTVFIIFGLNYIVNIPKTLGIVTRTEPLILIILVKIILIFVLFSVIIGALIRVIYQEKKMVEVQKEGASFVIKKCKLLIIMFFLFEVAIEFLCKATLLSSLSVIFFGSLSLIVVFFLKSIIYFLIVLKVLILLRIIYKGKKYFNN